MTGARPTIEARLAAAGLDPLPRSAWAEIDLDALRGNVAAIRRAVGPDVRVEPVVKADAYGHGLLGIARALEADGIDGLSVATLDEALALRRAGLRAPVLVLYPVPLDGLGPAARLGIDVAAGGGPGLTGLIDRVAADRAAGLWPRRLLRLQLEIETGLGRGGVPAADAVAAVRAIARGPGIRLTGIWTHLAAPGDPAATALQVATFDAAVHAIRAAGLRVPGRHLAASSGLLSGVAALDAVRPGLATYGIVPDELATDPSARLAAELAAELRPVLSLHARPVRVLDLPAGHGVSYGPSFRTARPSRIATLPLGYGDGWPRSRSNRAEALVRGVRVPLVGTVAMDAVMADVTDVPGPPVGEGDLFTLIGTQGTEGITARDLARAGTTISWEVVTAMAARLPRVYDSAAGTHAVRTLVSGG